MIEGLETCEFTYSPTPHYVDTPHQRQARAQRLAGHASSVVFEGLDEMEYEPPVDPSCRVTLAFKKAYPALWCAYNRGATLTMKTDGRGGMSLGVTNTGGTIIAPEMSNALVDEFLEQQEHRLSDALCDLSDKYASELTAEGDTCPFASRFAFEDGFPNLARKLKHSVLEIKLSQKDTPLFLNLQDALKSFNQDSAIVD